MDQTSKLEHTEKLIETINEGLNVIEGALFELRGLYRDDRDHLNVLYDAGEHFNGLDYHILKLTGMTIGLETG